MSCAESFLQSLKVIGFPQVNAYTPADFEPLFLDEELKPILETICDLNGDHVLTSEELLEYNSLSPTELTYYEKLAEDENLLDSAECEGEKRDEVHYLEECIALVTEEKNTLQKQKDSLKLHENILLEEKEKYETMLKNAKKQLQIYEVHTVPHAEAELASSLCSVVNVITELQDLIADSDGDSKILSSVIKDIDSYFNDEKEILKHVKQFLCKQLEVGDDGNFSVRVPGHSQSKLLREVHYLRNILKNCMKEEFSVISEKVKAEAIIKFFKRYEDEIIPHIFKISSSQLCNKLKKESHFNVQLKEKEKFVKLRLSSAVSEQVNGLCSEIGMAHSQEIIECFNQHYKKIQAPLEHLLLQRSRLELIVLYLNAYKKSFEHIKYLCESTSTFIKKEQTIFCNIKNRSEKQIIQQPPKRPNDYLCENSTLLTIYKILNNVEDQELYFVSHEEVSKKIQQLFEDQVHCKKLQDEKLHHLHLMEEQIAGLEKFIFKGKQFSKLLEMDTKLNVSFNKLDLKLSHFSKIFGETEAEVKEKEKMLERNENLQIARHLYIYAFLDPEHYEEQIKKIKDAYENILDSSLNQSINCSINQSIA